MHSIFEALGKNSQNRLRRENVKVRYEALSEDDKIYIQESFLAAMNETNKLVAKRFKDSGLKSTMVSSMFYTRCSSF